MEKLKESTCKGPIIIVNFKNTKKGKAVLKFAKKINNPFLIAAVPVQNLEEVSTKTHLITIAQHTDSKKSKTGFLTPQALKETGAQGTLLNHSEHPIPLKQIKTITNQCNNLKLKVIICTSKLNQVDKLRSFKPWAIAYEDPKFIGTKNAITDHPINILKFTKHFKRCKRIPLCGAGIHKKEDVENAIKLGCKGVLISSAVMRSKNPKALLNKLSLQ
jgi:triosephosphate isomerase (TIM)